jgi:hypothetical protein
MVCNARGLGVDARHVAVHLDECVDHEVKGPVARLVALHVVCREQFEADEICANDRVVLGCCHDACYGGFLLGEQVCVTLVLELVERASVCGSRWGVDWAGVCNLNLCLGRADSRLL